MATTATPEAPAKNAAKDAAEGSAKSEAPASGGMKSFLPLIIAVVAMPALAFVMTNFVLLPKLKTAISQASPAAPVSAAATPAAANAEAPAASGAEGKSAGSKGKINVPIPKILVNVAGTMGTRYLMTSLTLVGTGGDFKNKIEDNMDQLKDAATSALSSKTIADLEKPGARNVIRSELMTVFNNALGGSVISEIYITEMAIQ